MANRKPSKRPVQAHHGKKSSRSQHDRRRRLDTPNKQRKNTCTASFPLTGVIASIALQMQAMLDSRIAFRFPILLAGVLVAKGRRTVTSWLRGAGVQDDWDCFYDTLASIGKQLFAVSLPLLRVLFEKFICSDANIVLALDDTPTKRFGRHVEGANVHRNPTPGPADGEWMYGHNWVCLALLKTYQFWGVIALPLLSKLYVRKKDTAKLDAKYGWEFKTKHELGIELVRQIVGYMRLLGKAIAIWIVVDGAYATKLFLRAMAQLDITVVSRLRSNSAIFDLPPERKPGQRGRPCKYGKNKLSLTKRAASRDGWSTITYICRGRETTRRYKSFLATTKITDTPIRVVILQYDGKQWGAYFCTDPEASIQEILEKVAARWAIEECFHDLKETWRAGEQQVRNVWTNMACWQMNCWAYTLVEYECWDLSEEDLVDRSDRPWDNPDRRPSHADRRRAITGKMRRNHFSNELKPRLTAKKIKQILDAILATAA